MFAKRASLTLGITRRADNASGIQALRLGTALFAVGCMPLLCGNHRYLRLAGHLAQHVVYDLAMLVLRTEQNDLGVFTDSHSMSGRPVE